MQEVTDRLRDADLKVNISKTKLVQEELEHLGCWISRDGIKPLNAKVEAINNIATLKTKKQLRCFIDKVNCHRDM